MNYGFELDLSSYQNGIYERRNKENCVTVVENWAKIRVEPFLC